MALNVSLLLFLLLMQRQNKNGYIDYTFINFADKPIEASLFSPQFFRTSSHHTNSKIVDDLKVSLGALKILMFQMALGLLISKRENYPFQLA